MGLHLECLDSVDSTNSHARRLGLEGVRDGAVVLAETQDSGRGRLGRNWVSPRGRNIYMSVVLRSELPPESMSQISLMAGLAASETVDEWAESRLKWPNDVLVGQRKVVGILAELEMRADTRFVVLGIGVNVNMELADLPPDLIDKAGSIAMAVGAPVDRARVAGRLLSNLEKRYEELRNRGFDGIAEQWSLRSGFVGRQIQVAEPGGSVSGEVIGLAPDGALCLKRSDGREHRVIAGDVTVIDGYEME